jgi:hypothetical protein
LPKTEVYGFFTRGIIAAPTNTKSDMGRYLDGFYYGLA